MDVVGQIIGGGVARILIREKSGVKLEMGDLLLVDETGDNSLILQVTDLQYHSQVPQSMRELISGMKLEGLGASLDFMEPELRNYIVAQAKAILQVKDGHSTIPKSLPDFFNSVRHVKEDDLKFLTKPDNPLYVGDVRSGSKILDSKVYVNARDAISHHILIPATTGRGKSNLVKVMLWSLLDLGGFGILVLDPHDEYYGRNEKCLKDHPQSENLVYYSSEAPPGANSLIINLESIKPHHFSGIVSFSEAQNDAVNLAYHKYGKNWIIKILEGVSLPNVKETTLSVLIRKFNTILGIYIDDKGNFQSRNRLFSDTAGESTIKDIIRSLENGKIVVIDTSRLMGSVELLVGSIITGTIFNKYQRYKAENLLREKPVIGIVIEEAPRVLGGDVIATQGHNVYSTIAREGRKFNIGLIGITQLVSLIPKTILANMNTKIILGNEMAQERSEIMASASQDLSDDNRNIASLDKGEAIVSSIFTRFAVPIKTPFFDEFIEDYSNEEKEDKGKMAFI
ncbi:MAG: ATP-binding protein [Methanobacteriaceae archaeon]|nr:ATP-binding protein [Methanobacteriaceae archaeon]